MIKAPNLRHYPLPFPPEKPYIPPHKPTPKGVMAMTITAGFRCKDGVVIGADTEIS